MTSDMPVSTDAEGLLDGGGTPPASDSLCFGVAQSLSEVVAAWRLVYTAYCRLNIVDPNPHGLFTRHCAAGPHVAVMIARHVDTVVSTLTAIPDSARGLPLDQVYRRELDGLRHQGARLLEVGLLADRRRSLIRTTDALRHLMNLVFHFGLEAGRTDCVIGVHPHHSLFYMRQYLFEACGEPTTYGPLNGCQVMLLRGRAERMLEARPRGVAHALTHPPDPAQFARRFDFDPKLVANSPIGTYLRSQAEARATAATPVGLTTPCGDPRGDGVAGRAPNQA